MRVGGINGDNQSSPWELYENYRRQLEAGQGDGDKTLAAGDTQETALTKTVNETAGCETCKSRKYQDGSNDPGVSFKAPTRIAPEQAASAVRGHEMEHVSRNQSKARAENREVVSQSVTYHNGICPECGDVYVAGGTTRTTTKGKGEAAPVSEGVGENFSMKV